MAWSIAIRNEVSQKSKPQFLKPETCQVPAWSKVEAENTDLVAAGGLHYEEGYEAAERKTRVG